MVRRPLPRCSPVARLQTQLTVRPPSTTSSVPVMYLTSSDARNSAVCNIPGIAHAPHRTLLVRPADHHFGATAISGNDLGGMNHRYVHHSPQDRVHPYALPRALERDHSGELNDWGLGRCIGDVGTPSQPMPETGSDLTIAPLPCRSICGSTCLAGQEHALQVDVVDRSQLSSVVSSVLPTPTIPTLLCRTLTRPNVRDAGTLCQRRRRHAPHSQRLPRRCRPPL